MTYPEAIEFLYQLRQTGAKFGLENPRRLAALIGDPQQQLRFIHVAGTNGKGSTCAMLESIYRASGLRVGLYTSPHLVSFAERIQINRQLIPEAEVARLVAEFVPLIATFPADHAPTFFEVVTLMALRYFAEQRCDLVIWETGLGGRLDATNIVTPLASVITNIQFDHERWLGHTLGEIAGEKAGIIKPGIPVITGAAEPEALRVIQAKAAAEGSSFEFVPPAAADDEFLTQTVLPLPGPHQRHNAAIALATVRALRSILPVADELIRTGLEATHWAGRLQRVVLPGGRCLILDGAHNPSGAAALRQSLMTQFPNARLAFIVAVMEDKDWDKMSEHWLPLASRLIAAPVASQRRLDPTRLIATCRARRPELPVHACDSLKEALTLAAEERVVVVAGSLYLIGEVMEILQLAPTPASDEKALNEWTSRAADR